MRAGGAGSGSAVCSTRSLRVDLIRGGGCTTCPCPFGHAGDGPSPRTPDLQAQTAKLVSRGPDGLGANEFVHEPSAISADGHRLAFVTRATNLGLPDTDTLRQRVHVWNRNDDSLQRADLPVAGGNDNGNAARPSLSHDGLQFAFHSTSNMLHCGATVELKRPAESVSLRPARGETRPRPPPAIRSVPHCRTARPARPDR
jgi:hypothetical protein